MLCDLIPSYVTNFWTWNYNPCFLQWFACGIVRKIQSNCFLKLISIKKLAPCVWEPACKPRAPMKEVRWIPFSINACHVKGN